ncbi:hypothetical protein QUB25_14185 [Microcoleus sp. B3-D7]
MSFNDIHKLKPKKPKSESKQTSNISIEFLVLPGEQFNVVPIEVKHQTGGIISEKIRLLLMRNSN